VVGGGAARAGAGATEQGQPLPLAESQPDGTFVLEVPSHALGVIKETGIFQWLASQSYRLSRGRPWLLVIILLIIASVVSALLNEATTMLLTTPITIQFAITLGINPLALLLPEVLVSNAGGIFTLISKPTNILSGDLRGSVADGAGSGCHDSGANHAVRSGLPEQRLPNRGEEKR